MPVTQIIDNLYLGSEVDAAKATVRGDYDLVIDVRPLVDMNNVSMKNLDFLAKQINTALRGRKKVLVHCALGQERAPLVIAWYLANYTGFNTIQKAYDQIKKVRPMIYVRVDVLDLSVLAERNLY